MPGPSASVPWTLMETALGEEAMMTTSGTTLTISRREAATTLTLGTSTMGSSNQKLNQLLLLRRQSHNSRRLPHYHT